MSLKLPNREPKSRRLWTKRKSQPRARNNRRREHTVTMACYQSDKEEIQKRARNYPKGPVSVAYYIRMALYNDWI